MKFHFKLFLAGLVVPIGFTTFFALGVGSEKLPVESITIDHPYIIEVYSAKGEKLSEHKGSSNLTSAFDIAGSLGADVHMEDRVAAFPEIKMGIGSKITIIQAPKYTVIDAKKKTEYRSWVGTVGELLAERKIELGLDDKINFSKDTDLVEGMEIKITRVAITTVIEPEIISYKTTKQQNPSMEKGTKNVIQAGKKGKKNNFYLVTREDGIEKSKKFTKSEIVEEPIEEILEVGTKVTVYGSGKATFYKWERMENSGEMYYAAHKTLPKGTKVWVVNTANGKGVMATILDRVEANVEIDLSPSAFKKIGSLGDGVINVRVEKYYPPE